VEGQYRRNRCSGTGRANDFQFASDFFGSLAHTNETDPIMPLATLESIAVVTEFQTQFLRLAD
jgi:hypothetical protein